MHNSISIGKETSFTAEHEYLGIKQNARRRTTCLDTRDTEYIEQALKSRKSKRYRSRRERCLRRNSSCSSAFIASKTQQPQDGATESFSNIKSNANNGNNMKSNAPRTLHSQHSLEPTYFDVLTPSSSDEDDILHNRRGSSWVDIIMPSYDSLTSPDVSENKGKLSSRWSDTNDILPRRSWSIGDLEYLSSDQRQRSNSCYEARAFALLDVGIWITEQYLQDKDKSTTVQMNGSNKSTNCKKCDPENISNVFFNSDSFKTPQIVIHSDQSS